MCYKGIIGFIGATRPDFKKEKPLEICCFSEVLSDLSVREEITKYGTVRLQDTKFKKMLKNILAKFSI